MKITDITISVVDLGELEQPFWNSIIKTTHTRQARIEIHTDEGVLGMAPCSASASARATILGPLKQKLLGEDPLRIGYLWDKMYMGRTRKPVAKGEYITCMSVVDNALWDLKGKALGQPVWRLAGGVQARVWAYAAGGYYAEGKGLRELAAELESYVKDGFRAVKMKVGWNGISLREDAERVRIAREAIGPEVELMIDANNAWDANTAIRFGRMVEKYEPFWFEEPVHADDFTSGAKVAAALDMPVASGENEFTRWGFRDLINAGAAEVVQADPNICGGISEWLKIAALASANHLPMAPHGNPNVGACCVASVENGLITESYPTSHRNLLMGPVDFRSDGYIYLSDAPGLGIDWDEEAIKKYQVG
ncbi:MAG: mandelate racemase/muconate lactonizing enzyme family protein [Chloroflexi bacterium]|nr:mandelate racemase/muconate lactonizing enzyme family protein [Chloroflexota bacterium]